MALRRLAHSNHHALHGAVPPARVAAPALRESAVAVSHGVPCYAPVLKGMIYSEYQRWRRLATCAHSRTLEIPSAWQNQVIDLRRRLGNPSRLRQLARKATDAGDSAHECVTVVGFLRDNYLFPEVTCP